MENKKRIAFDLDNTLCKCKKGTPYKKAVPNHYMIEILNQLHHEGNYIMVFTARGMSKGRTRQQAINMHWQLTYKQLKDWEVLFDILIFGKPDFDLLIDDKVINTKDVKTKEDILKVL